MPPRKAEQRPVPKERCRTGIDGLDEVLHGGVPVGNIVLLTGPCGTGKTTLSVEFLVNGAKAGERGLLVSVTEPAGRLYENMATFDFFEGELLKSKVLQFVDMASIYENVNIRKEELSYDDIERLVDGLLKRARDDKLQRLVIDTITVICHHLQTKEKIREFIYRLTTRLAELKCTTLLVSEVPLGESHHSYYGVEEAIADGIILLGNFEQRGHLLRTLQVIKMRGTHHSRSKYAMELSPHGVILVPLLRSVG